MLFSPVTLKNYAVSCGYQPPEWVAKALDDETPTLQKVQAWDVQDLLDSDKRPWLHLVDSGISDNLGLRAFYKTLSIVDDPATSTRVNFHIHAKYVLIISINAFAKQKSEWILEPYSPPLFEVVNRVSSDQINQYNDDTI